MRKVLAFGIMIASLFGLQAQNIMNSDFELWSYGKPVNWTVEVHGNITSSGMVIPVEVHFGGQTSDAHSGNSAVRITSADASSSMIGFTMNLPGMLQAGESDGFSIPLSDALAVMHMLQDTTGTGIFDNLDSLDLSAFASLVQVFSRGVPCDSTPDVVTAWTRYIPQEGDEMAMLVATKLNGEIVDYAFKTFSATDTTDYHQIGVNFNTPNAPCDTIMIVISSATQRNSTSVLYVDDVEIAYPVEDGVADYERFPGSVYPNPATDRLYLHPNSDQPYVWTLTDLTGKALRTGEAVGETSIDTRDCPTGVYLLHISGDGFSGTRKVMIR